MSEGVLLRKVKVDSYASLLKDGVFGMELGKSDVDCFKSWFSDVVASD